MGRGERSPRSALSILLIGICLLGWAPAPAWAQLPLEGGDRWRIVVPVATVGRPAAAHRSIKQAAELFGQDLRGDGRVNIDLRVVADSCTSDNFDGPRIDADARDAQIIIGHACAPSARLAAPHHAAAGRLFIAIGEPPISRTKGDPTLYVPVAAVTPAAVLATALTEQPSARIAIVSDRSRQTLDLADALVAALAARDGTAIRRERIEAGKRTFQGVADQFARDGITDVALFLFPTEAAAMATDLKAAIPGISLWGQHLLDAPDYPQLAGPAADGSRFLRRLTIDDLTTPSAQAWITRLQATREQPTLSALATVAALQAVGSALQRSPKIKDSATLRAALAIPTETVLGSIAFDPDGHARVPLWRWWRWQDGKAIPN